MMMKSYNESIKINHDPDWPYIPDYAHRILITGGSGKGKTNALLNLIKHQRPDIDMTAAEIKEHQQKVLYIIDLSKLNPEERR